MDINRKSRTDLKGQEARILWFTGLSEAGKSAIANIVDTRLHALGKHTYLLDGDDIRLGLNQDLGFTDADRVENIRRVAEVASLMVDAGLITLVACISPFRSQGDTARRFVGPGEFVEIFVDTPIAVAEARDPKGLYKKARRGVIWDAAQGRLLVNFRNHSHHEKPPTTFDLKPRNSASNRENIQRARHPPNTILPPGVLSST